MQNLFSYLIVSLTLKTDRRQAKEESELVLHRLHLIDYKKSIVTMFRKNPAQTDNEKDSVQQQDAKVKELKDAIGPLSGSSANYCTDSCLRRYLEAWGWNVNKSKKILEETLKWRSTYKPEEIRWHEVAKDGETGKGYRGNFYARDGKTVMISRAGKQNKTTAEKQIRHLAYLLENCILNLPKDQEQIIWLIDFTGLSFNNRVPVSIARETLKTFQNHYMDRIALVIFYNPPRIFEALWTILTYLVDPKATLKPKFVYPKNKDSTAELMSSYFDLEDLPMEFGGRAKMQYDHAEYSKLMEQDELKFDNARRSKTVKGVDTNNIPLKTEVATQSN